MSEQKVLIDCRDAALGYEGRPIWEHLTFQVRRGDYLCIVGDNGSGKSTLLKSMLGLLRPLSGEIRLDESLRRGAIGYLPQQTRAQKDFPATVSEVVLSGFLSARGWKFFYTPAQKSQALQHMGKLGILELKDKCYRELSGGQQQRVLLARALCAARSLLILDEIGRGTSTFDGMSIARAVLEYCADPKRLGAKTLFATHYHELTVLEGQLPGVKNFNIAARKRKDEILFLRKIVPGGADQSYGIEVAGLAGLPPKVIRRPGRFWPSWSPSRTPPRRREPGRPAKSP